MWDHIYLKKKMVEKIVFFRASIFFFFFFFLQSQHRSRASLMNQNENKDLSE